MLADTFQLQGCAGGSRQGGVGVQLSAEALADQQFVDRDPPCLQQPDALLQVLDNVGNGTGRFRPVCQHFQDTVLHAGDVAGRIPAAGGNAAYFKRAVLECAKIAVGDGTVLVLAGGQENQPAVDAVQGDRHPGVELNLF